MTLGLRVTTRRSPLALLRFATLLIAGMLACIAIRAAHATADYTQTQAISAIASGEGSPNGIFGFSVAIEGDLAVVADMGISTRPGRVRTYARSNGVWTREADHDIEIYGDSSATLAFRDGTLILTSYDSTTSRSYLEIYAYTPAGWDHQYGGSTTTSFFESVATSGYIAVVGEPSYDGASGQNQGRIRIMRRDGNDNWVGTLVYPTTPHAGARFGQSVAMVAGAIVVGAPRETVTPYTDAGAAYVYELTIDTWNEVAHLTQSAGDLTNNRFGSAVAISGADTGTPDRMLISSPSNSSTGRSGRVHSYTRTNGTWTARTVLQAPSPIATDGWGCALALDNYWAAIGQCSSNVGATGGGAVEVVRFSPGFTSVDAVSIDTDPQAGASEYLGVRIDIDRDGPTVIVGNPAAPLYGNPAQGVVLFGEWNNSTLILTRQLDLAQGLTGATFGWLAADGDTVMVAANGEDIGLQQGRGAVYEYRRAPDGQYQFQSRIVAPDGMAGDGFGFQIALKGDVALITSPTRTLGGVESAGAVYAFHRDAGVWSLEAQLLPVAPTYETALGIGTGFDGDTALVSTRHGQTLVYQRSAGGAWTPMQTIDHQGWPLELSGDTAMLADFGANGDIGEVAIYTRVGGTWLPQGTLNGTQVNQGFGFDTSLDGDLLAVTSSANAAPVQLFRHGTNGWLPEASLLPNDVTPNTRCWRATIRVGKLAIGCLLTGAASAVYTFEKIGGVWSQQQKLLPDMSQADDGFGSGLAYNNSGSLLVGSPWTDFDFIDQGAVFVFTGDHVFSDGFDPH